MKGSNARELVSDSWMNYGCKLGQFGQGSQRTFMSAGKRSLCVKYERRVVWYAPDTTDNATSTAFCRVSTVFCQRVASTREPTTLTTPSRSYCHIQRRNKVCEHSIHLVQSGDHIDDIRAGVGIFLRKYRCEKGGGGLRMSVSLVSPT